jgi:hypothetical protein
MPIGYRCREGAGESFFSGELDDRPVALGAALADVVPHGFARPSPGARRAATMKGSGVRFSIR